MLVGNKLKKTNFDKMVKMLCYTLILTAKIFRYRFNMTNFYFQVYLDSKIDNCYELNCDGKSE